MKYSRLVEEVHNKCLKYRRLDAIIDSYEFKVYWDANEDQHENIVALIHDLKIKEVRKIILGGNEIENMTLRELRDLASKKQMKYYTKLEKEALRAELIRIRDKDNEQK